MIRFNQEVLPRAMYEAILIGEGLSCECQHSSLIPGAQPDTIKAETMGT